MTAFDFISDVHWDFWVNVQHPEYTQIKKFKKLFDKIFPEKRSDTLLIAGDIGHYNEQNELVFKLLKEYYKHIVWTHGNHDLYLVSKNQMKKYNYDSFSKLNEMIELSSKIDGVHYLDGDMVKIDGVLIGGGSGWYDFQYGVQVHNQTIQQIEELWEYYMNDSRLIKIPNSVTGMLDNGKYFQEQYNKLKKIHKWCDIIISHIGPDWSKVLPKYNHPSTAFYYFEGQNLLANLDKSTWIYGHTHDPYEYIHKSGCHLICNPLGYPLTSSWELTNFNQKVRTIEVEPKAKVEEKDGNGQQNS